MSATVPQERAATGVSESASAQASHALRSLQQELLAQRHVRLLRKISARNSKYLFLHAAARAHSEIGFTPVWCTANGALFSELTSHGLEAFHLGADANRSLQFLLSASTAVFCVNPREALLKPMFLAALEGAFKLQLWHGAGTKKIDLMLADQMNLLNLDILESLDSVTSIDAVLSPSKSYDRVWHQAFGAERVIRAGLPRNEALVRPATELEQIGAFALPAEDGFPKVLFAPTFTYAGQTPAWQSPKILSGIRAGLPDGQGRIFVKPHPFDPVRNGACDGIKGVNLIPADADIYPALRCFDLLITDKSSLLTDYLLTDRPIVILDHGQSTAQEDASTENPFSGLEQGLMATPATLTLAVHEALTQDTKKQNRARLRERIFATDATASCAELTRIVSTIVANRMSAQRSSREWLPLYPSDDLFISAVDRQEEIR